MKRALFFTMCVAAALMFSQTAPFPTAIATDQNLIQAKDRSQSQLNGAINNSTLSVVVDDGSMFTAYQIVTIDSEQMQVCSISTNTLTMCTGTRGFNGTSAASHSDNAPVYGNITSYHHNALKNEVKAVETALGANLANVQKPIYPYGTITPPADVSTYTWVNRGTLGSATQDALGITMGLQVGSTDNVRALVKTIPSTPYRRLMATRAMYMGGANQNSGPCWYDGTKFVIGWIDNSSSTNNLLYQRWNSITSWNSNIATSISEIGTPIVFWRIWDDGTYKGIDVSNDGYVFTNLAQETRTSFLTATHYGLCGLTTNNARPLTIRLLADSDIGWTNTTSTYVGTFFQNTTIPSMIMGTSSDGTTWTPLEFSYAGLSNGSSGSGVVRDPSIVKISGTYYVAHTSADIASASTSFKVISFPSLTTGVVATTVANPDFAASISGVNRVWAPEWFVDPADNSVHVFFCASSNGVTGPFSIYETHPTNIGMTTWSSAVLITTGATNQVIDPFVIKVGSTYYLFYKDAVDLTGSIQYSTSSTLTGTYTKITSGDWAGFGGHKEGPTVIQLDNGNYQLCFDTDNDDSVGIKCSTASALSGTWSTPAKPTSWQVLRHGTISRP